MSKSVLGAIAAILFTSMVCGCSSTTLSGSWRNPDYLQVVRTIYIVGVSKNETQRRIFEDEFDRELRQYGVEAIASYRDLNDASDASRDLILAKARASNADALLITRILGKRTEEVVHPGGIYGYPYDPWFYSPRPYYYSYREYYDRRFDMLYEPATVTRYRVITLECNLYDTATGGLIWSAQLETVEQSSLETMIRDFIEVVTRNLVKQGLI